MGDDFPKEVKHDGSGMSYFRVTDSILETSVPTITVTCLDKEVPMIKRMWIDPGHVIMKKIPMFLHADEDLKESIAAFFDPGMVVIEKMFVKCIPITRK